MAISSRVKPIQDPEDKKGKATELPEKMKMRNLQTCEAKPGGKPVNTKNLPSQVSEAKIKGLPPIGKHDSPIQCIQLAERILDSIESIDNNKGFTIGKEKNKIYCGSVIQRIPMGGYARIGGGQSIFLPSPPVENGAKMTFKFDKKRQLAVKVGNNVGKDWVVVVAGNGCIFLDTGSYASFHMPVYIVEQTGDYYKVDAGNRILLLGTGHHLMLYTKEAPIFFVRKHTVTHQKSIPLTAIPSSNKQPLESLKSDSLASNEPLEQMAKENKNVLKKANAETNKKKEEPKKDESKGKPKTEPKITIDEVIKPKSKEKTETIGPVVPPPPKVEVEDSKKSIVTSKPPKPPKPELKEIKGLSASGPPKPKEPTIDRSVTHLVEPSDEQTNWKPYVFGIGLILLILLVIYILYRYMSSESSPFAHNHSNGRLCRICHRINV